MKPVVQMNNISKNFGGVHALDKVNISLQAGEIHFLLGENGAGKSTLIKILMGIIQPNEGEILLDGSRTALKSPRHARKLGINAVFQELSITPNLPVWRNIWLGTELTGAISFLVEKTMKQKAQELLEPFEVEFPIDELCSNLSIAEQQIVEICKALVTKPKVLILDEATSSLYKEKVDLLLDYLMQLKEQGVSILYITHRLSEAFRIVDRITILRDGQYIVSAPVSEMTFDNAVQYMSGSDKTGGHPEKRSSVEATSNKVKLQVKNLRNSASESVSLKVAEGEILGIAGLQGHGQEELLYSIYGQEQYAGEILLNQQQINPKSPNEAISHGISLISGDRKGKSIFLPMSLKFNIGISSWKRRSRLGFINRGLDQEASARVAERLKVNTKNLQMSASALSGGNQQKLVAARSLLMEPEVILLDDPTRGIDISTKQEFHELLVELAAQGVTIVLVSSDSEELVAIANRVLVMRSGNIVSEITREQLTVDKVVGEAFER